MAWIRSTATRPRALGPAGLPACLQERYELLGEIGSGAFGVVLEARDRQLDRAVAIKLSQPQLPAALLQRFQREAQVLGRLEHPGIVRLFDHGVTADDQAYMVMERIEGASLQEEPAPDPAAVMEELAAALDVLHGEGLVHRDIKPANILLDRSGRAVLVDLGLVRIEGRDTLTATGQIVGTPTYMAPEVIRGEVSSPASDWYAWGVSLFEQLEGRPPYSPESMATVVAGLAREPPDFHRVDPAAPVAELARRALADAPTDRPGSAREVREILRPRRSGSRARPRPSGAGRPAAIEPTAAAPPPPGRRLPWRPLAFLVLVACGALVAPRGAPPPPATAPAPPAPPSPREVLAPMVAARLERFGQGPEGTLLFAEDTYTDRVVKLTDRLMRSAYPREERRWREALREWLADPETVQDGELARDVQLLVWFDTIERAIVTSHLYLHAFFKGPSLASLLTPVGHEEESWASLETPDGLDDRAEQERRAWFQFGAELVEGPVATAALRRSLSRLLMTQSEITGDTAGGFPDDVTERLALPRGELAMVEVLELLGTFDWLRVTYRGTCPENTENLARLRGHLEALRDVPADLLAMARALLAVDRFRNLQRCEDLPVEPELSATLESLRRLPPGWVELATTWCITYVSTSTRREEAWSDVGRILVQVRSRAQERVRADR